MLSLGSGRLCFVKEYSWYQINLLAKSEEGRVAVCYRELKRGGIRWGKKGGKRETGGT